MLVNILALALTTFLSLVPQAGAAISPTGAPYGDAYAWEVSNWEAGCDAVSNTNYPQCHYGFDIKGNKTSFQSGQSTPEKSIIVNISQFTSRCEVLTVSVGTNRQMPCTLYDDGTKNKMTAMFLPYPNATFDMYLFVSYGSWIISPPKVEEDYWNYTSITPVKLAGPKEFTIPTTEVWGALGYTEI
ncbi:hypothetical protein HYFRA_00009086 [Hymenoscyphus fraxineus]|uniref:Uncharacterized protein n=1 Tax=Hymenoscyphus fraxineus TaxID=746836 RepID=A0A9N9KXW3_9HELO|nr:hypothetical protein HYFRA_00009086 [Hymenoscyphus fraxineus]